MKNAWSSMACCLMLLVGCATTPSFTVLTDPAGADIYVDGAPAGKTPAIIKVKFTENAQLVTEKKILMVKLPGYKVKKEVISPEGALHRTLNLTLVRESHDKSIADVASKQSAQTGQALQAVTNNGVTGRSPTAGQATEAPIKDAAVSGQEAKPGQESQSIVKQEAR